MPYICRNAQGTVTSLHREAEGEAREFLADEHPEVQAFVGRSASAGFERLDADFIRVLEDLIDVLLRKQLINVTDLPGDAQHKLYARKGYRGPSALGELNLLGESVDLDGTAAPDFNRFG